MLNKLLIFTNIYQYETSYTFIQLLPVPTHDCRIRAYLFYITFFVSFMYCIYFYLVSSTLRIVSQGTVNIRIRIFYITFCFISHHSHNNLSMECDFTLDIWLLTEFKLHFSFFPSSLMSAYAKSKAHMFPLLELVERPKLCMGTLIPASTSTAIKLKSVAPPYSLMAFLDLLGAYPVVPRKCYYMSKTFSYPFGASSVLTSDLLVGRKFIY